MARSTLVSRWVAILKRTFGVRNRRSELMEVRSSKSNCQKEDRRLGVARTQSDDSIKVVPAEVFSVICNCSCTLAPLAMVAQCPN